jgi:hypothetical protein
MDCAERYVRDNVDSKRPKYLQVPAAKDLNEAMREKRFVRPDSASAVAKEQIALIHIDVSVLHCPCGIGHPDDPVTLGVAGSSVY